MKNFLFFLLCLSTSNVFAGAESFYIEVESDESVERKAGKFAVLLRETRSKAANTFMQQCNGTPDIVEFHDYSTVEGVVSKSFVIQDGSTEKYKLIVRLDGFCYKK